MKNTNLIAVALIFAFVISGCSNKNKPTDQIAEKSQPTEQRIVSLNAAVTEILAELGIDGKLVGRDATSVYPQWVADSVKNFGPPWTVGPEALLSVKPDIVFAGSSELDPEKVKTLENAGVKVILIEKSKTADDAKKLIATVSEFTKNHDYQYLIDDIDSNLAKVETLKKKPKVLFVYARGTGLMQVAGSGTSIDELIKLSGAENAAADIENMKPLTPEGLVKNNPDVILMFDSGIKSLGGENGLFDVPGMKETNAFKNKAVISMESSLLSELGPRLGQAAYSLNQNLKTYAK